MSHLESQNERMKRCADCKELKPYSEFPPSKKAKDGRHSYCKVCNNRRSQGVEETSPWRVSALPPEAPVRHRRRRLRPLVAEQGGLCAICQRPDPEHVDHDHETGKVRGILCFNCNGGLGQFKDDLDALLAAATYLATTSSEDARASSISRVARAGELREAPV